MKSTKYRAKTIQWFSENASAMKGGPFIYVRSGLSCPWEFHTGLRSIPRGWDNGLSLKM